VPDRREASEKRYLEGVCQADPELECIVALGQDFAALLRERRAEELDGWLERARHSGLRAMRAFAIRLGQDYAAVKAASLLWSNGQLEAQVNRLKVIKRVSYGRAKFDLLRRRVLYAA